MLIIRTAKGLVLKKQTMLIIAKTNFLLKYNKILILAQSINTLIQNNLFDIVNLAKTITL
jgi:hypothetical protein